jgi:LmbE family N-acetylglucosaminyl deacetylase
MIEGPLLVVAAHPDDETLGCGGTIARAAAAGVATHVLFLSDGVTSRGRDAVAAADEIAHRQEAAHAAAKLLGAEPPIFGDLPDNSMDSLPLIEIVRRVEASVAAIRPATVITHHGGDLNIDHQLAHRATLTACRPLPGASVRALWCFETVSSTEWASEASGTPFVPTLFIDVSAHLDRKLAAADCYATEMRQVPHARSRENLAALARVRGATVGTNAAEAFVVVREIV